MCHGLKLKERIMTISNIPDWFPLPIIQFMAGSSWSCKILRKSRCSYIFMTNFQFSLSRKTYGFYFAMLCGWSPKIPLLFQAFGCKDQPHLLLLCHSKKNALSFPTYLVVYKQLRQHEQETKHIDAYKEDKQDAINKHNKKYPC